MAGRAASLRGLRRKVPERRVVAATVLRRARPSPSFARVTLGGEALARFEPLGFDQWSRMFIPQGRPGEPGCGPLSAWAQTARPGDSVGVLDQGLLFLPEQATGRVILAGDETAVPAVAGALRDMPATAVGEALLEVPHAADAQELAAPKGVTVTWLPREGTGLRPGELLLREATARLEATASSGVGEARPVSAAGAGASRAGAGDELPYVYAAGEAAMAVTLSQTLKRRLGWPTKRFTAVTYWRLGA